MSEIISYKEIKPISLNIKDKRLLYELDFNVRQAYSQLAKKIGVSKQGVEYKLNNLLKKGIIKGFYPVINVPKLGYKYCRLLLTLHGLTQNERESLINYLLSNDRVFWLFSMQGQYDLIMVIWAKNISEFKNFVEGLEFSYGRFIKHKIETIATDVIHLKHRFLLGGKRTEELHIKETNEKVEIDKKDWLILDLLTKNPRMSLVNMSQEIKESPKVIGYRIKKMENEGLIEAYRPILDYNILGYTYYKIFINIDKISKGEITRLKNYLKSDSVVIYIIEGIGLPADIDIEIVVRSNQELFNFINDLKSNFPKIISEYTSVTYMDTLKVRYLPAQY